MEKAPEKALLYPRKTLKSLTFSSEIWRYSNKGYKPPQLKMHWRLSKATEEQVHSIGLPGTVTKVLSESFVNLCKNTVKTYPFLVPPEHWTMKVPTYILHPTIARSRGDVRVLTRLTLPHRNINIKNARKALKIMVLLLLFLKYKNCRNNSYSGYTKQIIHLLNGCWVASQLTHLLRLSYWVVFLPRKSRLYIGLTYVPRSSWLSSINFYSNATHTIAIIFLWLQQKPTLFLQ